MIKNKKLRLVLVAFALIVVARLAWAGLPEAITLTKMLSESIEHTAKLRKMVSDTREITETARDATDIAKEGARGIKKLHDFSRRDYEDAALRDFLSTPEGRDLVEIHGNIRDVADLERVSPNARFLLQRFLGKYFEEGTSQDPIANENAKAFAETEAFRMQMDAARDFDNAFVEEMTRACKHGPGACSKAASQAQILAAKKSVDMHRAVLDLTREVQRQTVAQDSRLLASIREREILSAALDRVMSKAGVSVSSYFTGMENVLRLGDRATKGVLLLASSLLTALALTACLWGSIGLVLLGSSQSLSEGALRLILCVAALGMYDEIFYFFVRSGQGMLDILQTEMPSQAKAIDASLKALGGASPSATNTSGGFIPTIFGYANPIRWIVEMVRFVHLLGMQILLLIGSSYLLLLRVSGPLFIAISVLPQAPSVKVWLKNIVWVCTWPLVPGFVLFCLQHQNSHLGSDNPVLSILNGVISTLAIFLAPKVSAILLGTAGEAGALGAGLAGRLAHGAMVATNRFSPGAVSHAFGAATGAMQSVASFTYNAAKHVAGHRPGELND